MQKKIKIYIDEDIKKILTLLKKDEKKAYIVGGYIRDKLLGIEAKDCDLCSNLSLYEIFDIFKENNDFSIEIISEKLNIVRLKYRNKKIEIARLRKDLKYHDNRKNFDFEFVNNIEEDLPRRDFTINSFAYDGENIYYINESVFQDINERKIKFIGEAKKRIKEDPFRILRAFRIFSEKNLLSFDEETIYEIEKNKNLIWTLPIEMIQAEFIKMLKADNYLKTFKYINQIELFNQKFNIGAYHIKYEDRIKDLFNGSSNLSFLKTLKFSEKKIKKIFNN